MEAQKTPADEKFKFIFPSLVVFALFSRFIVTESCKFNAQFFPVVWVVLTLYIKEMAAKLNFYYVCTPKKERKSKREKYSIITEIGTWKTQFSLCAFDEVTSSGIFFLRQQFLAPFHCPYHDSIEKAIGFYRFSFTIY